MADVAIWAGVAIAGAGAIGGGYVFVTNLVDKAKKDADDKLAAAMNAFNTRIGELSAALNGRISEAFSAVDSTRKDCEERTTDLRQEFTELLSQDRQDWRRDVDRLERAVEAFGRMGESVAAMGRSVEHLTAQLVEHRSASERETGKLQAGLAKVSEGLAELRSFRPRE